MVNISLSQAIILKHINYIKNSTIKKEINKLLVPQFCEIIRDKFDPIMEQDHIKFCKYLIKHIDKIEYDFENSLFTAKPHVLHEISKSIQTDFPYIKNLINGDHEIEYGKTQRYWQFIYDAFGYNKFVGQELLLPIKSLLMELDKFNINLISNILKDKKGLERIYSQSAYQRTIYEICELLEKVFSKYRYSNLDIHRISLLNEINDIAKETYSNKTEFLSSVLEILNRCKNNLGVLSENEVYVLCNYDNAASGIEWGAYAYVLSIGLKVCPYCNRNYITPLYSNKGKMRADLDHFLSKELYPYFSMSIYNLIPSCKFCNSSLKGTKEFTYNKNFNPYNETSVEDLYRFTYSPLTIDCFNGEEDLDIRIEYNEYIDDWEKIKTNNDIFCIETQYQYHKDIIKNLIKKRFLYDEAYINYLAKTYSKLFLTKDDVVKLLLSSYDYQDVKNAPLGKLLKDIIDELDFH